MSEERSESTGPKKPDPQKPSASKRRKSRQLVMQALYQWQMTGASMSKIESEFGADNDLSKVDIPYFQELVRGVTQHSVDLDRLIEPYLDRAITEVDPIELALVKMGCFELQSRLDVPYRVVINEGVELAKKYGGTEGHRFVNSLLDKLARKLRYEEVRRSR